MKPLNSLLIVSLLLISGTASAGEHGGHSADAKNRHRYVWNALVRGVVAASLPSGPAPMAPATVTMPTAVVLPMPTAGGPVTPSTQAPKTW